MILRVIRAESLALLGLMLVGVGGCSSSKQAAATRPESEAGLSERDREIRRVTRKPLGILNVAWLKSTWFFDDFSDKISGSPSRFVGMMENKSAPDQRRAGITGLTDRPFGQKPPYTVRYAQIAEDPETDYMVRATAIRSLNRSRETRLTPLFVKSLEDRQEMIRLEACKALNRMPDVNAVPALLKILSRPEEDKDVRIAAAEALRHYKRLDVARALVGSLGEKDFSIAWQAQRSLRDITHQDLGYDESAWLNYLTSPGKPLG